MRFLRESRLTTRILAWVICTSVLMFSAVTALTILQERQRMYLAMQEDASRNVSRNIGAISIALWNFDIATLNATLLALTQSGSIVRAEVSDEKQKIAEIDRPDQRSAPDSIWEIPILGPDESRLIGSLKIFESYDGVRELFVRNLASDLVSELVKIAGLAAVLFFIIYSLITRHLQDLAGEVANLEPGNALSRIKLHRKKVRNDELDTLVDSINRFRGERAEAEKALLRDIDERKRVEAALNKSEIDLSEAMRIAQLAYWEYDLATKELILNDQYYSLHRISAEQAGGYRMQVGDFLRNMVHPEYALTFAAFIQQALQAAHTDALGPIEIRILCSDGATRWMLLRCKLEQGAGGEALRLIGTIQDITQRKLAQDALRATQSELARVTQLTTMGQLSASIAHEINQPLAAMVANSNAALRWLSRESPEIDEAREALEDIASDGRRASEVIGSIRAMFKKGVQERTVLDVNELICEVLALVDDQFRSQQVSVETELADQLPHVFANRTQLQQVILNLITNAVEAMGSVTGRARVLRVKSGLHESDGLLITLEDSGTGIDPKEKVRIFDAFFTTKSHGMGMGLAICRSIIETHHGRLWVSPGPGHGSIFYIVLPVGRPAAE